MSDQARDTQFRGFAELLAHELRGWEMSTPDVKQIIARRAYDLVKHTLEFSEYEQPVSAFLPYVPDLTTLPEVKE